MFSVRTLLIIACVATVFVSPSSADIITLNPSADTFIGSSNNSNHGALTYMRVRRTGNNRALVRFDQSTLASATAGGILQSAHLEIFVESNNNSWSTGREIDLHRLLVNWTELGATFNCPIDTDTSNSVADCAVQWNGGTFSASPTATYLQANDMTGVISLDVTADVAAFMAGGDNFGWIVKKREEGQNGSIEYTAREGTASNRPRLVLDVFFPPTNTPTNTPTHTPTHTPTNTPTLTPTNTPTQTPNINCGAAPIEGCRQSVQSNKSSLLLRKKGGTKDKLLFKWIKGEETDKADLGNPALSTNYTFCVYDQTANVSSLVVEALIPPGGTCNGRPCWKSTGKGFKYNDRLLSNDGMKLINLKSGPAGRAKIVVKGQGSGLGLPTLPLNQDQVVIAQIKNDRLGGECWEARFSGPANKNDSVLFKDKGDAPIPFVPTATQTHTHTFTPTFTPTGTPVGSAATATATSTPTETPTLGPPTFTPTVTQTPTATPTPDAKICELNSPVSRLFLQLQSTGVLVRPSGSIAISCGGTDVNNQRPCSCEVVEFDAIPLLGIGDVCVAPAGPCSAGVQACSGGVPLDMRLRGDHNINNQVAPNGSCTSQANCASRCATYCAPFGAQYSVLDSSCEGFCLGGSNHEGMCTEDSQCPGGTCPGQEPAQGGVHAGVCNCSCLGKNLGTNAPANSMACDLGLQITVERDNDQICGNVQPAITLSPMCGGLTTTFAQGQSFRANNGTTNASRLPPPPPSGRGPLEVTGATRTCQQIDDENLTGLKFVGYLMFYDSSLGDILAEEEFICQ